MKLSRILSLILALLMLVSGSALAEFPLVTEPTELDIYARVPSYYPDVDLGKVSNMKYYEELSGVKINWQNIGTETFTDSLNAMIASGEELPDIIMRAGISTTEMSRWAEEEIIIDLRPYLEEYAPNFWKLYNQEKTVSSTVTADNGAIYGLPQIILAPEMRTPSKLWFNKKAMEKIGMEDPTTLDELVAVLTAIRDSDWNGNGEADEITLLTGNTEMYWYFMGSFGLHTRGIHHDVVDVDPETGAVRVYALSDNFREFLDFMTKMYQEKLIYPEIFTESNKQAAVFAASDRLSCFINTVPPSVGLEKLEDWYTVNHTMVGPEGYAEHTQTRSAIHSTGQFIITADCPEELIPVALKWVDYFYSEEGSALALVGVEGQDWEVRADGSRGWTDAALATRTENQSDDSFRAQFGFWPGGKVPACFYSNLFAAEYDPIPAACAHSLLENHMPEVIWPIINFTDEEREVITTADNDIKEYIKSFCAQVMTGEVKLTDDAWADFKATVEAMGADELVKVYEAALTRIYGEGEKF